MMQSQPPENARIIGPGQIAATRHAVTKFVRRRASDLCKGRTGWWGERAVIHALWLHLENVIATTPDESLERIVNRYLMEGREDAEGR